LRGDVRRSDEDRNDRRIVSRKEGAIDNDIRCVVTTEQVDGNPDAMCSHARRMSQTLMTRRPL
jgi:hypothetical protein